MTLNMKTSAGFVTPASRKCGESTEVFLLTTQSNGRNKFGIANFLMREIKKNGGENSPPRDYLFSKIHAKISSYFISPAAVASPTRTTSSLLGRILIPFVSRKERRTYMPMRLFPSTNA